MDYRLGDRVRFSCKYYTSNDYIIVKVYNNEKKHYKLKDTVKPKRFGYDSLESECWSKVIN